jgi:tRNA-2-methylthio-N6-dimethylallyladenosine synthase
MELNASKSKNLQYNLSLSAERSPPKLRGTGRWRRKYYLFIIGCQMNYSDAERLSNILKSHGCEQTTNEQTADLIIVLSCSVRQKAMDRIHGRIKKWQTWRKEKNIKIILTGCVLPVDKNKLKDKFDAFLEIRDIASLPKLLKYKSTITDQEPITNADYLAFKPDYSSSFRAYIPIMTGCNNYCTFCAVPYTRGPEISRPSSEIINEVKLLIKQGYKEIMLLGQNVNAYIDPEKSHGQEVLNSRSRKLWEFKKSQPIHKRMATTKILKDFAELLKKINAIEGDFWIRFLSSNPQDISDELVTILPQLKKVTKYFHFALQSGDNEILRRMNRRHTREDYLELVKKIRASWPGVAITTDIIVGFSNETKKQFQNTADIMNKVGFDMAYISEYSPRPGTTAQRFFKDDVPKKEKVRRKKVLNEILKKSALKNNKKLVGQTVKVLVEQYNKKTKINTGKTEGFKTIQFKSLDCTGEFINIFITKADAWGLTGQLVK